MPFGMLCLSSWRMMFVKMVFTVCMRGGGVCVVNDWDERGCVFVCVVGPGFVSTSPAFVRRRASRVVGSDGRLAQKTESGLQLGGRDCVDTIIPTSCRLCLLELMLQWNSLYKPYTLSYQHHLKEGQLGLIS